MWFISKTFICVVVLIFNFLFVRKVYCKLKTHRYDVSKIFNKKFTSTNCKGFWLKLILPNVYTRNKFLSMLKWAFYASKNSVLEGPTADFDYINIFLVTSIFEQQFSKFYFMQIVSNFFNFIKSVHKICLTTVNKSV